MTNEKGYFFINEPTSNDTARAYIEKYKDDIMKLCDNPEIASGAIVGGVYIEYRPNVGAFGFVASISQVAGE